ncbi:BZ3500_MvSof-1268-A1-R1_Chr3-3g06404 [Microbotryum saponariae]|uniref:BZ3500_MvSof-1268-A1-R1_Chr3-3g06404 protein n=1 Tax=Microbotryum saponariae TaxID=289078 RepID=A0A2X0MU46_9BASI|nr:BZ3500_MvSof-1268-A1-R1_Chr3-3g06404 [Microbotryum saponariae]SDA04371.1 BZ3501_MvSof-1269-A2-R1_Chr3-2g06091 [Microbotryum saponariae]
MLLTTPIRSNALGFTLCGEMLRVYLVNAYGVFATETRDFRTDTNKHLLSRVLLHLLELDDRDYGVLASTSDVDDVTGKFSISDKFLPPRVHDFDSDLGAIEHLDIHALLFRRRSSFDRATSAFRVTATHAPVGSASAKSYPSQCEYGMTVAWVEQSRLAGCLDLRKKMHAAPRSETQGLSRIVGVHRGAFRILSDFLPDDEVFEGIEPRALEVVFFEECYSTLDSVQDTEAMARVVLGVIHGKHPKTTSAALGDCP